MSLWSSFCLFLIASLGQSLDVEFLGDRVQASVQLSYSLPQESSL